MATLTHFEMAPFDVAIVGSGPAGAIAATVLARAGVRVALIDKATFPRDKACGDVIGPKAVRILNSLGIQRPDTSCELSDVSIVGPNGTAITLPAEPGLDYDGVGWSCPRRIFDELLHKIAVESGAIEITARVTDLSQIGQYYSLELSGRGTISAKFLIGADGSNSSTAERLGLVNKDRLMLGFAVRTYVTASIELPTISLWNAERNTLFPGYGWAFPSPDGQLNLGVGVGVGNDRKRGSTATNQLPAYARSLVEQGIISGRPEIGATLGGWIKMGTAGTTSATDTAMLVGDAAGLVNPLQGEGIAQAIASGVAAAEAVIAGYSRPGVIYRDWVNESLIPYQRAAAVLHRLAIGNPKLASLATKVLFVPPIEKKIASTWGIFWNDLADGAGRIHGAAPARILIRLMDVVDSATGLANLGH